MKRSREPEELPPTLPMPSPPTSSVSPISISIDSDSQSPCAPVSGPAGYAEAEQPRTKIASLSHSPDAADGEAEPAIMTCLLHREHIDFPSYEAYEAHYHNEHMNRCIECRRNFPSPMYLNLHGDEWHDPFVAVRREKGEHTYACFVDGCERKCGSMDKRRRHLIDKHGFPNNFFFLITQFGIDGRQSLLDDGSRRWQHRRRSSTGNTVRREPRRRPTSATMPGAGDHVGDGQPETESDRSTSSSPKQPNSDLPARNEKQDVQMDDLAGAMSAMTFIPRSIRFGRGGKAGFARW